jgi:hypothetical protein
VGPPRLHHQPLTTIFDLLSIESEKIVAKSQELGTCIIGMIADSHVNRE